jgi:hypothetical protein
MAVRSFRQRRRVAGLGSAAVHRLEDRRLMSLTVSLQTPTGATSAVVTAGEVLTLDVIATVAAPDGTTTDDGLQDVEGSFLSAAVGTSAVAGNLAVTGLTSPFNALGSVTGSAQDLNGDGNVDVGSGDTTDAALTDGNAGTTYYGDEYFLARSSGVESDGVVSGATMSFPIATVTYTVTSLNGGGQANINFRPRDTSTLPSTFASHWTEDDSQGGSNEKTGTFRAGTPFRVYASASTASTTGTVTATAFGDTNGDGARDGTETGLAGATVYVDLAGSGTYSTSDPSGLTDASGAVTITGVPAGQYGVREVPPTGYAQSSPADDAAYTPTVTAGGTVAAGAFGLEPDGSVTGSVYVDANGNGSRDAGEVGSSGTTVYVDVNDDGTYDAGDVSTTTGSDGTFTLVDVPPGTDELRVVAPAGQAVSQPAVGSSEVTVAAGGTVSGEVFGLATAGSVSGTVYVDANHDGTDDAGDTVAPSGTEVFIDLDGTGTQSSDDPTATVDSTGAFTISGVTPGIFNLYPVLPAGYTATEPSAGSYSVNVTAGETASGFAFGIAQSETIVTGTVYIDANQSGAQDAGEAGLAGVTVYVDTNGNGFDSTDPRAVTDANGTYTITGVPAGDYTVADVVPAGDTQTTPASGGYPITVADDQTTQGGAFGVYVPTGTVTGTAYTDANGDGADDSGDSPRAGATVYLDANGDGKLDAGEVTTTTAADGTYSFAGLAPGTYTVRQVVPLGSKVTEPIGNGYPLTVSAGVTTTGVDFGIDPLPAGPLTTAVTTAAPTTGLAGTSRGTLKVRVTDGSSAAFAGAVTFSVYPSLTGVVTGDDVAAATVTKTVRLKPGKSTVVPVPYTLPVGLAAGSYELVAAASTGSTTGPAVGVASGTTAVTAATADLTPTIVAPAAGLKVAKAGKRMTVPVRITNTGNTTASGTVDVTVNGVTTATAATAPVGSKSGVKVKLKPRGSTVVSVTIVVPAGSAGSYTVSATIAPSTTPADDNAADDTSVAVATR